MTRERGVAARLERVLERTRVESKPAPKPVVATRPSPPRPEVVIRWSRVHPVKPASPKAVRPAVVVPAPAPLRLEPEPLPWVEKPPLLQPTPQRTPQEAREARALGERKARRWLQGAFPKAFTTPPRPLALGIARDIEEVRPEYLKGQAVWSALRSWCSAPAYRAALALPRSRRTNLDGTDAGEVSPQHRAGQRMGRSGFQTLWLIWKAVVAWTSRWVRDTCVIAILTDRHEQLLAAHRLVLRHELSGGHARRDGRVE